MNATRRIKWGLLATMGLMVAATGCQTWVAGMTLPSGFYLQHPPQYIPPSPSFPLSREEGHMAAEAVPPPAGVEPLPPPIPGQP
jgi:hypothetical protein